VFFAFIGIEACCAIVDKIQDGKRNAARVILASFTIITAIYIILQFALLCIHGVVDINPFLAILPKLTSNQAIIGWGNSVIYFAILSSFLGGFYGMFYFNNWNLYVMGKENSILFSRYLVAMNKGQVPWVCVLVQSFLVMLFLVLSASNDYLVTMSDFGTAITYFLSVVSFLTLYRSWVGFCALASCLVLMFICANNLVSAGLFNVIPFVVILTGGVVGHKINEWLKD
jgi:amino acid transporter